jgi:hypothetical protein
MIKVKVIRESLRDSSSPSNVFVLLSTGIKADDIEPSAKSSLKRFGILKATKKVSDSPVAPKYRAITISLTKPRIRLMKVASDIRDADFAMLPFSLMG